ncbi:hypothetical protein BN13_960006 [Nostocoides jenkinsii Ben 74]|jgi:hypothetical protein|uniref:Uncharacterized protein n=1 Tax=Nostocoides jenkinsii Ben 74 TaxID=1193518 RepID=A0A077MH05_9MICO|nr:hypothetical protein BN13_960006 [Tetrasphaera jenkinsii Ben 74]
MNRIKSLLKKFDAWTLESFNAQSRGYRQH